MDKEAPKEGQARTLIEKAYRKIKQMIFDQRVIPGQRLVYQDLAQELDMSRTPIINALIRLEEEGFLVSEAYRGFQVKPIGPEEAWDLFGMREALEAYAVEEAIKRADKNDLEQLRQRREAHASYKPPRYTRKKFILDAEFHVQIAAITRNRVLERALKTNFEHVYLRFPVNEMDPERMVSAIEQHNALMKRIASRDIKGSVEIIRKHVVDARDHLMRCLSSTESEELFEQVFPGT
ncbi:MAG: GntR family transcriptional regulator [Deltaproteobacteria bacterium]|nr:GntR family transcriptional regulator [Deltaproteobacteria bacterium]